MGNFVELISEEVKLLLIRNGYIWLGEHVKIILLGLLCTGLFPTIYKILKYIRCRSRLRKLAKDLHPFYEKPVIDKATDLFVPTKCQNIDPSNENEPRESFAFATKEKLIPFFIKKVFNADKNDQRYFLVLADSGMGKTTFMINLFTSYQNRFAKKYNIRLLPLGDNRVDEFIAKIEDSYKINTILLLDGLDDDPKAWDNHEKRLIDLMQQTRLFREVIITCRTQFFASATHEPYETGVRKFDTEGSGQYTFRKIYLSPFDDKDIELYLDKKYGRLALFNRKRKTLAKAITKKSPNLMVRPMLLSYIDDLVLSADNGDHSTPVKYNYLHDIYEVLINKWILREARKVQAENRQEFIDNLYLFSNQVALRIIQNKRTDNGLFIKASDILPLAQSFEINLDELELKGRSLLNRNAEGKFKFAHKSIFEYFMAVHAYQKRTITKTPDGNLEITSPIDFEGLDLAKRFFAEMFISFKLHNNVSNIDHVKKTLTSKYEGYVTEWSNSYTLVLKKVH